MNVPDHYIIAASKPASPTSVQALTPRSARASAAGREGWPAPAGHQFVVYGDCCSGIPGARHEATFASVNAVVARLAPQPEFVCFLGDEVRGLVADAAVLREQWRYWFQQEMAWLDRDQTPLYHSTGNHTAYDAASEGVFREVLAHLPRNGPPGQQGLSYFVRRGDLLLVFVNTMWSGLGDGRVETRWLDSTLAAHGDAAHKLVLGHHPAWPINGFSGDYQRNFDAETRRDFWRVLVRHGVLAYLCSHIMSFDVQVHEGVLQVTTAGAGTQPLMPEDVEYLHCVQAALDAGGLRYQVLDTAGAVREWLSWPLEVPPSGGWARLAGGEQVAPEEPGETEGAESGTPTAKLIAWRFDGVAASAGGSGEAQTLLNAWSPGPLLAPLWIGLLGPEQRLAVLLSAAPGRSPHYWLGPALAPGEPFSVQVAMHTGMGPGGLLWRWNDSSPWSSLLGATPWGAERYGWQERWSVGHDQHGAGAAGRPFRGSGLEAAWCGRVLGL